MEQESGVYINISDNSVTPDSSTQELNVVVPMITVKGDLINTVSIDNFEDKIGYDTKYNSNYVGLKKILNSVSQVKVLRLNQNATIGNLYLTYSSSVSTLNNVSGAKNHATIEALSYVIAIANKTSGYWRNNEVKLSLSDGVYTLTHAYKKNNTDYTISTYTFTIGDSTKDTYWKNVDFGDLWVDIQDEDNLPNVVSKIESYSSLLKGSNDGTTIDSVGVSNIDTLTVSDIDTTPLNTCGCNIMLSNGISKVGVVNTIATTCIANKIHFFIGSPYYKNYENGETKPLETWAKQITSSEYVILCTRPDTTEVDGKTVYICPSVSYAYIYASMMKNHNNLNYPPAGVYTGRISTESLCECDYEKYGNELKTNRLNWQRIKNNVPCMWEQRTTYGEDSDLSYVAPVFIIDSLSEDIINFEGNFSFRYITGTDLLTQETGLRSILQGYVDNGFLYSFELNVPTFAQAQTMGRKLSIPIGVRIAKDSEVITINLTLNN